MEGNGMFRFFTTVGLALTILVLSGCSGEKKPKDFPKIYSSSITVLNDDGPVDNVKVTLFAKDNNCPWPIGGTTDSSGVATLYTYGKFQGAPAGEFNVVLSKNEIENADQMSTGSDDDGGEKKPAQKSSFRVFSLIDPKYSDKKTTPLTLKIEKGGIKETFKLGPPVRKQTETIRTDLDEK